MNDTLIMRVGYGVAMLALLFLVLNGIGIMFGGGDSESSLGHVVWGLAFLVCPLTVMIGLYLCASRPKLGLWMVVGGVVASAGIMFWMAFITVPIGLLIIVLAVKRAGYTVWPFSRAVTPA